MANGQRTRITLLAVVAVLLCGCQHGNRTVYDEASRGESRARAERLIEEGQDVNQRDPATGLTPLYAAVMHGHMKMANLLLDNGADPNVVNEKDGRTPLHVAASKGYNKITLALLRNGANPNVQDSIGNTPLHYSMAMHHEKTSGALRAYGADPAVANNQGITAQNIGNGSP